LVFNDVIVDKDGEVLSQAKELSGINFAKASKKALDSALQKIIDKKKEITYTVATGYGRNQCKSDRRVTEITCHAKGAFALVKKKCTVVDIGGQDTKVIPVDASGAVGDFSMNRKCAAGTGAFLEEMARKLRIDLVQINSEAKSADTSAKLSSFCTVFAMTEVLKRVQEGFSVQALARGVYESMVTRTVEMTSFDNDIVVTGGVAQYHSVFIDLLKQRTGVIVEVIPNAQFAGALGAALIALEKVAFI